jgi:hypothetical protein
MVGSGPNTPGHSRDSEPHHSNRLQEDRLRAVRLRAVFLFHRLARARATCAFAWPGGFPPRRFALRKEKPDDGCCAQSDDGDSNRV